MQREFQKMLREAAAKGCAVFLSSHALSEVEHVADRVGIIRRGRLAAVETVSALRSKAMRRVDLELDSPADAAVFLAVPGVRDVTVANHRVLLSLDGEMGPLLNAVVQRHGIVDISTQEADLEEIFLTYYRDEERTA